MALRDITLFGVFCALVIWLALQSGCSKKPVPVNPTRDTFPTSYAAQTAAQVRAVSALGQIVIGPTHGTSMEPLIKAGDWLILQTQAFSEVREGRIYGYEPKSGNDFPNIAKDYASLPVHRARMFDHGGWLMEGDNAPTADTNARMTEQNMVGLCIYIAHIAP